MMANISPRNNESADIIKQKQMASPPPPIPHITNNYISLQATIANLVLFTHKELRNILETLSATTSDFAKKKRLLDFIVKIRVEFIKVYVLTKWARVSKDISKTIDVVSWLNGQQNCFHNLVSALFNIEKQLASAKLRTPDIETALEVLTAGRPYQASRNFFPQKKLTPTTILQTLHDLDILLSIRLALTEKLPPEFSHYKISDGRVTFFIENSYHVQLGIADDSVKARFFFVDFKFDFQGAYSPSPRTKGRLEMESNEILAKKGLIDFFEMLLKFTQNYKLATYYNQLNDLRRGLYSDIIVPKFQPDKSLVTINYWPHYKTASAYKNTINIGISRLKKIGVIWIRDNQPILNHGIEFGQTNNSVETLLQQIATLHVRNIILNVFNALSRLLDHNSSANVKPAPGISRQLKSITAQRAIYLQPLSRNDQGITAAASPQSPSTQTSSTPNTPASIEGQQREPANEFFGSDQFNHEIVTMISPEKLKIRLTGSRFTIFSIDKLTGKAILTNSTHLVSSAESAINDVQGRSAAIADLLIKLRLTSIQEDICNRARAAGWVAKANIPIHSSVVRSKFPSDTRMIFCLRQPTWPERWFLLVTLSVHGLPKWWITQMVMKEGTWNINFTEEISLPQEEFDGNYSYAMLDELNISTFARIRTEALRKELDRCKIRYRLVPGDSVPIPAPDMSNEKDTLPVTMFDVSSISETSSWAESSVFMRLDRRSESDETVKVRIQGRMKHTVAIEAMPSDDPYMQFHPKSGIFYLSLTIKSSSIPLSMVSQTHTDSNLNDDVTSQYHKSELITKVAEKFLQIEKIVNHISLLRSLSLKIVSASMHKITFEYGPSMTASISLPVDDSNMKNRVRGKGTTKLNNDNPGVVLELHENSPHRIVGSLLQEMINADGLLAVVWVLRKCLPLYMALQELENNFSATTSIVNIKDEDKSNNGNSGVELNGKVNGSVNGIMKQEQALNGTSKPPKSSAKSVIINIHSLKDFTIHFLHPSSSSSPESIGPNGTNRSDRKGQGRICIQLKLIESNGRPLSVFVSEIFPNTPHLNPNINGPTSKFPLQPTLNNASHSTSPESSPDNKSSVSNSNISGEHNSNGNGNNSQQKLQNGQVYKPLTSLWSQPIPDIPSAIPLQQGLSCPISDIQLVMRKIRLLVMDPESLSSSNSTALFKNSAGESVTIKPETSFGTTTVIGSV